MSPIYCKATEQKGLAEIWRDTGSTWLWDSIMRSIIVFSCTPKVVDIPHRTGVKFTSKPA
eukprot:1149706-Pelagomonas_calceolata.AAC.1